MNVKETRSITAHNLYDFLLSIQDGMIEGYRLSEENSCFPVQMGPALYTCTLVKPEVEEQEVVVEVKPEVPSEVKPRGRVTKVRKE